MAVAAGLVPNSLFFLGTVPADGDGTVRAERRAWISAAMI
jgi:hypothetical protein